MIRQNEEPIMRRRALLPISIHGLVSILRKGAKWEIREGLPKDAKPVGVFVRNDRYTEEILLIVESEEFAPIPEGHVLPMMDTPVLWNF